MTSETRTKPSAADAAYFGAYEEGYFPYAETDLPVILDPILGRLEGRSPLGILEVGCASGQFSAELAKRLPQECEATFWGVDIALPPLRHFSGIGVCASAYEMPFADNSFDVVCFPASLHHLFPLEQSVAEAARVLRPGGFMYCIEPNYYHPQRRFFMRFEKIYRMYRDANDVPIRFDHLTQMMNDNGLADVRSHFVNINFREPGKQQQIQNWLVRTLDPDRLSKWVMPWFVQVGMKQ